MSKKFTVYLSAMANVETKVEVEAEDEAEAATKAVAEAKSGGVVWDYEGVDDSTIESEEVSVAS